MRIVVVAMVMFPCLVLADTDCRILEYSEHYELICIGEPGKLHEKAQAAVPAETGDGRAPVAQRRHRPQAADLETMKASRTRLISEQRRIELELVESVRPQNPD
jgi:hypothetical protein